MKKIMMFVTMLAILAFSIPSQAIDLTGEWTLSLRGEIWLPIGVVADRVPYGEDYTLDCQEKYSEIGPTEMGEYQRYECVVYFEHNYDYPPDSWVQHSCKLPNLAKVDFFYFGSYFGVIYVKLHGYDLIFPFDFKDNKGTGDYQLLFHPYKFVGRGKGTLHQ